MGPFAPDWDGRAFGKRIPSTLEREDPWGKPSGSPGSERGTQGGSISGFSFDRGWNVERWTHSSKVAKAVDTGRERCSNHVQIKLGSKERSSQELGV